MNKGTNKTKQIQTRRYREQSRREEGNGGGAGVKWAEAPHLVTDRNKIFGGGML